MAKGIKFFSKLSSAVANATFFIKNADFDEIISRVILNNTSEAESGPQINNLQQYVNELGDISGTSEGDTGAKDYATEHVVANGDNQKECIEKFDVQVKTNIDDIATNVINITQNSDDIQAIEDSVGQPNGICPLDANSEVPVGNLPQEAFDGLVPQGNWDADTNSPDLTVLTPDVGNYWEVSVDGATNLGGITEWFVGDWAIYTSSGWVRNVASAVKSVNGKKGIVTLDSTDVGLDNVTNDAQLKRSAGDFVTFTEKTDPVEDDVVLIEDSEDSDSKKTVKLENLLGGGGGGGSFAWELNEGISPIESFENGISLYDFDYESEMAVSALVVVPLNYKPGKHIMLENTSFFSGDNADNVFFRTETTLFKDGEDITTNVNTHVSTNTEKTLTTANELLKVGLLDLTDNAGEINSIAVGPGDILKVKLLRENSSETTSSQQDARMLKFSSSLNFDYKP